MSSTLKEYLFPIIIAAIFCSIIKSISFQSQTLKVILHSLCGIFMTLTMFAPILNFSFKPIIDYFEGISIDASYAVENGSLSANSTLQDSIMDRCAEYILDKASEMKADISVEVLVSNDDIPKPYAVIIDGNISPYAKSKLVQIIRDDLGISEENQTWN